MKLEGKVAIVTGGNAGIGRGIAVMFAQEGAKVCIVGRNPERGADAVEQIKATGSDGFFISTDVSESENMQMVVSETVKRYGKLDIMVNNAGIIHQGNLIDLKDEDFDHIIKNDLRSVFLGSKYGAIQMVKQGNGGRDYQRFVDPRQNIRTVMFAVYGGQGWHRSVYAYHCHELAPYKITANILAPGANYSELTTPMYTPAVKEALLSTHPAQGHRGTEGHRVRCAVHGVGRVVVHDRCTHLH
jgi:3-oxoacyl-[acyl-carrier protein] reductase